MTLPAHLSAPLSATVRRSFKMPQWAVRPSMRSAFPAPSTSGGDSVVWSPASGKTPIEATPSPVPPAKSLGSSLSKRGGQRLPVASSVSPSFWPSLRSCGVEENVSNRRTDVNSVATSHDSGASTNRGSNSGLTVPPPLVVSLAATRRGVSAGASPSFERTVGVISDPSGGRLAALASPVQTSGTVGDFTPGPATGALMQSREILSALRSTDSVSSAQAPLSASSVSMPMLVSATTPVLADTTVLTAASRAAVQATTVAQNSTSGAGGWPVLSLSTPASNDSSRQQGSNPAGRQSHDNSDDDAGDSEIDNDLDTISNPGKALTPQQKELLMRTLKVSCITLTVVVVMEAGGSAVITSL